MTSSGRGKRTRTTSGSRGGPRRTNNGGAKLSAEEAKHAKSLLIKLIDQTEPMKLHKDMVSLTVLAERIFSMRRLRDQYFPHEFASGVPWDILIILYRFNGTNANISFSQLVPITTAPATTVLRWTTKMVNRKMILQHDDPTDGRRACLMLSGNIRDSLDAYFNDVLNLLGSSNDNERE